MSISFTESLQNFRDWPLALALFVTGVFLLVYFTRGLGMRPAGGDGDFAPLDAETLKLLKDLESKAREFDAFVADKIFEENKEGQVASDENWATSPAVHDHRQNNTPHPPRRQLRLIKNPDLE